MMIKFKKQTKKQEKPILCKGTEVCNDCRNLKNFEKVTDDLLDQIFDIENDIQLSLEKDAYIRATHICEAPAGKEGDYVYARNDDETYDLHLFLSKIEFALLKLGLEENFDLPVLTFNYCPESWEERLPM